MDSLIKYRVFYRPPSCNKYDLELFVSYEDAIDFLSKIQKEGWIGYISNI